jgi:hypothetical protein
MPATRRLILSVSATLLLVATLAGSAGGVERGQQHYLLYGDATDAADPQNPDNDVVQFNTTAGGPVFMFRNMNEVVAELDNQLELKYYMQNRNCGAGSPRIDLGLDTNGDGRADAFLEGHVEDFVCPNQNTWVYEDLTDDLPRWGSRGLSGGPGPAYEPWDAIEAEFGAVPVVYGMLVEDSQVFKADNRGIAYYDLVSIGNFTFEDHSDTARCPAQSRAPSCNSAIAP